MTLYFSQFMHHDARLSLPKASPFPLPSMASSFCSSAPARWGAALLLSASLLLASEAGKAAPGFELSGTVTTDEEHPIAGAFVFPKGDLWKGDFTGADGKFHLRGLQDPKPVTIEVMHPGYFPKELYDVAKVGALWIRLDPRPPQPPDGQVAFRGRIVDASGQPVANALLHLIGCGPMTLETAAQSVGDDYALTDTQGNFVFFINKIYTWLETDISVAGFVGRSARLLAGSENPPVVLSRGVTLRGRVASKDRPVARVEVTFCGLGDAGDTIPYDMKPALTQADGSFTISAAPDQSRLIVYGVQASLPPGDVSEASFVNTGAAGSSADAGTIQILPGRALTIQFVPNKKPSSADAVRVTVERQDRSGSEELSLDPAGNGRLVALPGQKLILSSSARGQFAILPPEIKLDTLDDYHALIAIPPAAPPVPIAAPATPSAPEKGAISGLVLDSAGHPLEGAIVLFDMTSLPAPSHETVDGVWPGFGQTAITGADGQFHIEGIDPSLVFDVVAVRAGFTPGNIMDVYPERGPITFRLEPAGSTAPPNQTTIRGRVVDAKGEGVPYALIQPIGANVDGKPLVGSVGDSFAASDSLGNFTFNAVAKASVVTARVFARGLAPKIAAGLLPGQENPPIVLDPGVTVTGRLAKDGQPVPNATVRLSQTSQEAGSYLGEFNAVTDSSGAFTFPNIPASQEFALYVLCDTLPPGDVSAATTIRTLLANSTTDAGSLPVTAGKIVEIIFHPKAGGSVQPGTLVTIDRDDVWDPAYRLLGADGRFQVNAAPGEKLTVSSFTPGTFSSPSNVVDHPEGGASTRITVSSPPEATPAHPSSRPSGSDD